jgi:hypothetical protein
MAEAWHVQMVYCLLQVAAAGEVDQLQSSLTATNDLLTKAMEAAAEKEAALAAKTSEAAKEVEALQAKLSEVAGALHAKEELREARWGPPKSMLLKQTVYLCPAGLLAVPLWMHDHAHNQAALHTCVHARYSGHVPHLLVLTTTVLLLLLLPQGEAQAGAGCPEARAVQAADGQPHGSEDQQHGGEGD